MTLQNLIVTLATILIWAPFVLAFTLIVGFWELVAHCWRR